jgi:hypothetical protein
MVVLEWLWSEHSHHMPGYLFLCILHDCYVAIQYLINTKEAAPIWLAIEAKATRNSMARAKSPWPSRNNRYSPEYKWTRSPQQLISLQRFFFPCAQPNRPFTRIMKYLWQASITPDGGRQWSSALSPLTTLVWLTLTQFFVTLPALLNIEWFT